MHNCKLLRATNFDAVHCKTVSISIDLQLFYVKAPIAMYSLTCFLNVADGSPV